MDGNRTRPRLGLRGHVVAAVALVSLTLTLTTYAAVRAIILPVVERHERLDVMESLGRAEEALQLSSRQLELVVLNWSRWDDAYDFVRDPKANPQFETNEIGSAESMVSYGAEAEVFVDTAGRVAFAGAIDPRTGTATEAPPAMIAYARQLARELRDRPSAGGSGLIGCRAGLMMVVGQEILRSNATGPPAGVLVFGRYITKSTLSTLSEVTDLRWDLARWDDPAMSADMRSARARLSRGATGVVEPHGRNAIAGYASLEGVDGRPVAILRTLQDRDVVTATGESLDRSFGVIAGIGLLVAATSYIIIDLAVVGRIRGLVGQIDAVRASGDPSTRVLVSGNDEISDLAHRMNGMLGALEQANDKLAFLAERDPLTGVFNRRQFQIRFEMELEETLRMGDTGALAWLDLDGFKEVNDRLGHAVGDAVLKGFAGRLRDESRAYSVIGRLGGDEFALILPHVEEQEATAACERLVGATRRMPIRVRGQAVPVAVSAGVVLFPRDGTDMTELLAKADEALYHSKSEGRSRVSVYRR